MLLFLGMASGGLTRGQKMLNALKEKDKEILSKLNLPKHESTKGLTENEKSIILSG